MCMRGLPGWIFTEEYIGRLTYLLGVSFLFAAKCSKTLPVWENRERFHLAVQTVRFGVRPGMEQV